jgi:putative ABC transport system permease protein
MIVMKKSSTDPPRFALRFLQWFCPPSLLESIEGDLTEEFERDIKRVGAKKARRLFIWQVMRFFRSGIILRNRFSFELMSMILLRNYFTVSYRYLARNRTFSVVNILGLALGMAAAGLIYQYVDYERSYDAFHKNANDLYRVSTEWNKTVTPNDKRATTMPWSGPSVKEAFPEVKEFSRFASMTPMTGDNSVRYEKVELEETKIFLADPGFLNMFSFPLLEGDARTALSNPHQIILTQSVAVKYFGKESPLGKTLFINAHGNLSGSDYKITGVMANPPANSHMTFDFLVSYSSMWEGLSNGSTYWHWDNTYCYLLLHPGADVHLLEKKMSDLRVKQFGKEMTYFNDVIDFKLQPIRDIHLYSSLQNEIAINGNGRSITFLSFIGIFILLSAYINYINLSTVKAIGRRTEIGIRKVVGSSKMQLNFQVMIESLIINVLALVLAVVIAVGSAPLMEYAFGIQWPDVKPDLFTNSFLLIGVVVLLAGIVLSSLYPAFVVTAFRPADVLKGTIPVSTSGANRWTLRKSLTVVQFAFCIAFTTGTFVLYQQLAFMREHDLGMNMNQVVAVRAYGFQPYQSYQNFKEKLSTSSLIQSVGSSSAAPGDEITMMGLKPKVRVGANPLEIEVKWVSIDENFFNTLDVEFLAGRNFSVSSSTEKDAVILNEAAAKALGFLDPGDVVNQPIHNLKEKACEVVGVIKNYHQRSLKDEHEAIVFVPNWFKENDFGWNKFYYFIKLNPSASLSDLPAAMKEMEGAWKTTTPDHPFSYFFLDNYFESHYKSEMAFSSLFLFFSTFAIFIACLGLFGLVAYATLQRTKEIGIRKVLGASVNNILVLLSRDFVRLIVVAGALAIPFVIFTANRWLESYAFRINLDAWLFILPVILVFVLSLITVVIRSLKVAVANPVDSIRYE